MRPPKSSVLLFYTLRGRHTFSYNTFFFQLNSISFCVFLYVCVCRFWKIYNDVSRPTVAHRQIVWSEKHIHWFIVLFFMPYLLQSSFLYVRGWGNHGRTKNIKKSLLDIIEPTNPSLSVHFALKPMELRVSPLIS